MTDANPNAYTHHHRRAPVAVPRHLRGIRHHRQRPAQPGDHRDAGAPDSPDGPSLPDTRPACRQERRHNTASHLGGTRMRPCKCRARRRIQPRFWWGRLASTGGDAARTIQARGAAVSTTPKPVKARKPNAEKAALTGGKAKNSKASELAPDSGTLKIKEDPNKTNERQIADLIVDGVAGNAMVMLDYSKGLFGERGLTESMLALKASSEAMCGGDLKGAESMLVTQAVVLNSIFGDLARRAAMNMGQFPDAVERYMRLSLKAQGQCRATLETLAAIKNPPVVFARQANINNGGQQQVNNGEQANSTGAATCSPAQETQPRQNKLLEATNGERLDFGAQGQAGRANQDLETVGAINRPA